MDTYFRKESQYGARHKVEEWSAAFREASYHMKSVPGENMKTLVHTLQLHQIEIEMQNLELRRTQIELQAARDEYVDLFDFSPVGYLTTSDDGAILNANRTVSTLLGVDREKLTGELLSRFVSKEAQDLLYFHRKKPFKTDAVRTCELAMVRADGAVFDAQMNSILVADSHGDFTQIRTAVSDISERKRLTKALRESEEQLRQSRQMAAIGTMAGGIAHDFNNLLMVIIGNLDLAEITAKADDRLRGHLAAARKAGMRAADIIRQIVTVSRQKSTPRLPVTMISVVEASLKRLGALFPDGITLKREFSAVTDTVIADEGRMHQVLSNLCENAVQAMEKEGGQLTIGLSNVTIEKDADARSLHLLPGRYLKLSVSDTGPGIDPKILDQIFTPYFTTKSIGKGSGLGLSVVYGIILNHNGRISVSSDIGKGTTFDIYLPVKEKDEKYDR